MKKLFSYITITMAALLLTGCMSNTVSVSNDEAIKFNGGSITKTDTYKQMITTASYDTSYALIKALLTQVDMQLLEKDTAYVEKVKEEDVTKQYDEIVKQAGDANKAFTAMTQQLGLSIKNEEEAKRAIRYTLLVEQCVIEKGSTDKELEKAYEQQYGEKVSVKYAILPDQKQAEDLQKELVAGSVKIEDIVTQYNAFQTGLQNAQTQQAQQAKFVYNNKYTISTVDGENGETLSKKTGILKDADEATLFQRSSKDVWLAPMEMQSQNTQASQTTTKQYLIVNPIQYTDATKAFDDTIKSELKKSLSTTKLQDPKEVEKVMREYRKSKGFEINDAQLKKIFDAYQKSIDTPSTSATGQ